MKITLSFLILFFIISNTSYCQIGPAVVTKTSIGIYNSANQDIKILLGAKSIVADTFKLDTFILEKNSVWYSGFYETSPVRIKIQTGQNFVGYSIKLGNYYLIFWNNKKKYWDIKKTKKRGS